MPHPFAGLERRHEGIVLVPLVVEGAVRLGDLADLHAADAVVQADAQHVTLALQQLRLVRLVHRADPTAAHRDGDVLM